ncbi:hypothetical protein LPJ71_000334 [Coemansia sp. S17]|nr:hypothetical protein LPJ71_000334 [Coemansia sp. S17]
MLASNKLAWVSLGIDPGIGSVLTAAIYGIDELKKWVWSLSNNEYHLRTGHTQYTAKLIRAAQLKDGLCAFESAIPDMHTSSSAQSIHGLHYLFSSDKLVTRFQVNQKISVRQGRWRVSKQHPREVVRICCEMTWFFIKEVTIISVGTAIFPTSFKSHKPAPRIAQFVKALKADGWTVVLVDEHNMSQACSACHHKSNGEFPYRLCDLGSAPGVPQPRYPVTRSSHFVRQCSNPDCGIIVNRDINVAKNIAFLGLLQHTGKERPFYFNSPISIPRPNLVPGFKRFVRPVATPPATPVPPVAPAVINLDRADYLASSYEKAFIVFRRLYAKDELPEFGTTVIKPSKGPWYSLHARCYPSWAP